MNEDMISIILGIVAVLVIAIYFLWRSRTRKNAAKQLEEEFLKKEDEQ